MEETDGICVLSCERCPELVASRSRIVNGVGPLDADLLFVGEGPGEREDAQGEPFVGRSGAVFDEVLRENGLARTDVRITNCVRCRPPGNRDPTREELGNCRSYLDAEIEAVDPSVIVALGKVPAQHLLGRSVAVTREVGTVETVSIAGTDRPVLVCVHPAATLYDPGQRGALEQAIRKAAGMANPGTSGQSQLGDF